MEDYKQNIECVNCQLLSLRDKERLWPCCDKPMLKNKTDNEVISLLIELTHDWIYKHPEKTEHIILKWAAEHPEPDPVFEKLKTILDSNNKDGDDILHKVVKWYVEDYAKQHE